MNMTITKQTRILLILSLLGMGLVMLTRVVRPHLVSHGTVMGFVFGVLPNFGAAIGLPGIIAVLIQRFLKTRSRSMTLTKIMFAAVGITLLGLFAWELEGYLFSHLPVDPFDLLATALGGLIVIIIFFITQPQTSKI